MAITPLFWSYNFHILHANRSKWYLRDDDDHDVDDYNDDDVNDAENPK